MSSNFIFNFPLKLHKQSPSTTILGDTWEILILLRKLNFMIKTVDVREKLKIILHFNLALIAQPMCICDSDILNLI